MARLCILRASWRHEARAICHCLGLACSSRTARPRRRGERLYALSDYRNANPGCVPQPLPPVDQRYLDRYDDDLTPAISMPAARYARMLLRDRPQRAQRPGSAGLRNLRLGACRRCDRVQPGSPSASSFCRSTSSTAPDQFRREMQQRGETLTRTREATTPSGE